MSVILAHKLKAFDKCFQTWRASLQHRRSGGALRWSRTRCWSRLQCWLTGAGVSTTTERHLLSNTASRQANTNESHWAREKTNVYLLRVFLRSFYTERQWLIWSVSVNTCIIHVSDQLGCNQFWSDLLDLLIIARIDTDTHCKRALNDLNTTVHNFKEIKETIWVLYFVNRPCRFESWKCIMWLKCKAGIYTTLAIQKPTIVHN